MNEPEINEPEGNQPPPPNKSRLLVYAEDLLTRARKPGTWAGLANWSYEQLREFVAGVRFLTIIPLPGTTRLFRSDVVDESPVIGSVYFPIIGLLMGLLLCLIPLIFGGNSLFNAGLPLIALAGLVVTAEILLTGGLHLDGLMDSCDGLFGGTTRENKLEIMHDSYVGSFGILGIACVLLLKFAFFSSMDTHQLSLSLLIALPTARAAMLLAVALFPSARTTGLGSSFRQTITLPRLLVVMVISLLIALIFGRLAGLLAWIISNLAAFLVGFWAMRGLGGLTGDIYGAIAEFSEVCALLVLVLMRFWL